MKLLLCFTLLLIIVNSVSTDLAVLPETENQNPPRDYVNELSIFVESVFNHFGLEKPSQILQCFDNENSALFFRELCSIRRTLEDSRDRKSWASHIDFIKLELINKGLESTYACVMMTQDFTDLLDALKIDERDPDLFAMYLYFYYQALYPRLADDIQPLVDSFKAKDFSQAGDIFGGLLECMIEEIKEDDFAYLAFAGFLNGASSELNIDFPKDSLKCHNSDSALAILRFLWKLSVKVAEGGVQEAPLSTLDFWNDEGKQILDSIPQEVVDCHMKSEDIAKLSERLGIRVGSKGFGQALKRFITKRKLTYFASLKGMRASFEDHNFIHAGYTWGHLLDRFAHSLPYHEEPQEITA